VCEWVGESPGIGRNSRLVGTGGSDPQLF